MKKDFINHFFELDRTEKEMRLQMNGMCKRLSLDQIYSLSGQLRKLLGRGQGNNLLIRLIEEVNFEMQFFVKVVPKNINPVLYFPWNEFIWLSHFPLAQEHIIQEWLNSRQLIINSKSYSPQDIIEVLANKEWIHSDSDISEENKDIFELKISNDILECERWVEFYIFHISEVLLEKIQEFINHIKRTNQDNPIFKDFYKQEIERFSKKITHRPNEVEFYFMRWTNYYELGEFEEALQDYDACINLKPDYLTAQLQKCLVLHNLERYQDAINDYSNLEKTHSSLEDDWIFSLNYGNVLYGNKQFNEAIEKYKRAIRLNTWLSYAYNNIGRCYKELWDPKKSIDFFKQAIVLIRNEKHLEDLWLVLLDIWEHKEARGIFKELIRLNPNIERHYLNLWNVFNSIWQREKAIEKYSKAIALNKQYYLAYFNRWNNNFQLWEIQVKKGDFSKATVLFEKSLNDYKFIDNNNFDFDYHSNMAWAFMKLSQYDKALEYINKAIKRNPHIDYSYNKEIIESFLKPSL